MSRYQLTIVKDRAGQWRWRLRSANGRKIANGGEGYKRQIHARRMAKKLFPWLSISEGA